MIPRCRLYKTGRQRDITSGQVKAVFSGHTDVRFNITSSPNGKTWADLKF